jgi:predicted TIM-barrel fold metal-dependent hydrolase
MGVIGMSAFEERKIDCHVHILDPARFPYAPEVKYEPSGQEIGTAEQLAAVRNFYGVNHCLIVGPNSGYGNDNRCLLDTIRRHDGSYKGIAVVPNTCDRETLAALQATGIVGIAINATYHSVAYYANIGPLISHLEALGMYLQIQTEGDQLVALLPHIEDRAVKILVDHCGRPIIADGLKQPGFAALCRLGASGRCFIKLSGFAKFSRERFPHRDAWPFIEALVESHGLDGCMWASDWPHLRAPERMDYGPLLQMVDLLFPRAVDRAKILWDTPMRLFQFGA